MSQVLSALLHGVCTLHTSYKESAGVWVDGCFSVGNKGVVASTADFLPAMQPHELWNGPLPVCLVELHKGRPRRLRLVLTSQDRGSGLLFGYAADRCADPDWLVVPDGSQSHAWRLLHAVSQGRGTRFSVGNSSRSSPRQVDDAANRAKDYHFESLHKIYFYDAWRCQPELNQHDSLLHLQGCCRRAATGGRSQLQKRVPLSLPESNQVASWQRSA